MVVETTINIGGSVYKLKYPNSAIRKIDKELDYSAMHIVEKVQKYGMLSAFELNDISVILWGGMLGEQPGLQVDEVADIIPISNPQKYGEIVTKVFDMVTEIYGIQGDDPITDSEDEGKPKAAPGTGTGGASNK
jgi:hypothetical protein